MTFPETVRDKLPSTLAYPVERSELDRTLAEARVTAIASITFAIRQRGDVVARAIYTGEHRRGWVGAGTASLFIFAVPVAERRATADVLLGGALKRVCEWIRRSSEPGVWREADHVIEVAFGGGRSSFRES
jgi:hypothetical protein